MKILTAIMLALGIATSIEAQTDPNAKIDLTMIAPTSVVGVNEEIEVQIVASAQTTPQRYLVADIVFGWNPTELQFIGLSHEGSHPLLWVPPSGMPCPAGYQNCEGIGGDYTGINESIPPADGNALYYGYGKLGSVWIIDEPVQIVKLRFKVISSFSQSDVYFIPEITVDAQQKTIVYGSYIPGLPTTGILTNATVIGNMRVGDIDGNGVVNSSDLAQLIAAWGQSSFNQNPCDLNRNGIVDSADLGILLDNWG
jgi:hypothetical protein